MVRPDRDKLSGVVELDETSIGGWTPRTRAVSVTVRHSSFVGGRGNLLAARLSRAGSSITGTRGRPLVRSTFVLLDFNHHPCTKRIRTDIPWFAVLRSCQWTSMSDWMRSSWSEFGGQELPQSHCC